jgi:DNA-binding transcriptional ArsR family regulator
MQETWPFQALGDETRFRVVRLLASSGDTFTAGQLAAALQKPPSHLSKHLQLLEIAGITEVVQQGSWHFIRVRPESRGVDSLCAAVLSMGDDAGLFAEDLGRLLAAHGETNAPRSQLAGGSPDGPAATIGL